MRRTFSGVVGALCIVGLSLHSSAQADDCGSLNLLTSVDLVPNSDHTAEFIPVTIEDKQKLMLLDTGGAFSEITPQAADEFGFSRGHASYEQYNVSGEHSSDFVRAPLKIGTLKADEFKLIVAPDALFDDPKIAGIIGPDILTRADIDVDFGTDKLNLISSDHWPASAVAVVPMTLIWNGHIVIPVKLDGHMERAILDTGASNTTLVQLTAESTYGLKMGSPDAPEDGALQGRPNLHTYHHAFKTLEFEGIAVSNPQVELIPDPDWWIGSESAAPTVGSHLPSLHRNESGVTMLIGMNVLRHFHLYIAYKESKLYITPAGQAPTQDASATQPAAPATGSVH